MQITQIKQIKAAGLLVKRLPTEDGGAAVQGSRFKVQKEASCWRNITAHRFTQIRTDFYLISYTNFHKFPQIIYATRRNL